jgi:hypothetical protein
LEKFNKIMDGARAVQFFFPFEDSYIWRFIMTNHYSDEDEVMRTRMRYLAALRAGMSIAEASAYANNPNSAELCFPAPAELEPTAAPPLANGSGAARLNSSEGSASTTTRATTSPVPMLSVPADDGARRERIDADHALVHDPRAVLRALLAQDFNAFCEFAFSVVRPGIPFKPNWHIEAMAEKLSQVAGGESRRLIITVPPRNLKSLLSSVDPARLVPRTLSVRARGCGFVLGFSHTPACERLPPACQASDLSSRLSSHAARPRYRSRDHNHEAGKTDRYIN